MNPNDTTHASTPAQGTRLPNKTVYAITERPDGARSIWTRIGVAFTNRDGSITLRLDALPVNGVLQVRDADERREGAPVGGAR
jgi:hypothetical protein